MVVVYEKMMKADPNWGSNVKKDFKIKPQLHDITLGLFQFEHLSCLFKENEKAVVKMCQAIYKWLDKLTGIIQESFKSA